MLPAGRTLGPVETRWLDEREQQAWRGLIATMVLLDAALDRQLQRDQQLSHAHYMILAMLSQAPERTLHMSRLATLTHSSQSRLSHAVARLEEEGQVVRSRCPQNRRAVHATLTDSGMENVRRAAPGHVAEVRRLLFDRLDDEQVGQLIAITGATLAALHDAGFDATAPLDPASRDAAAGD